jgi:hypothetical protein
MPEGLGVCSKRPSANAGAIHNPGARLALASHGGVEWTTAKKHGTKNLRKKGRL